jgi:hypothetical protein
MFDGNAWSKPILIDQSGLAGYPRTATDASGRLYLVWERNKGNQVVPIWNQFSEGSWNIPQILNVETDYDAWYPTVDIMPDGKPVFTWSSRSPDYVTIDMEYSSPLPPMKQVFLPITSR